MPPNSIIVGMDALPSNMDLVNDQTKLELGSGLSEINYIFGTVTPPVTNPPVTNPPITNPDQPTFDASTFALIGIPVAAAAAGAIIAIKKKQTKSSTLQTATVSETKTDSDAIDTETIFNLRPEIREDDKEIIKFISENGGQALESELRKKFLQPRTTMWRAVKRLERQGIIEITKKDLQNLVKLKKELEEEE